MAGRKYKNTVDYFPHFCTGGKTMYILEARFGNNGYAVWYKTLELLGNSDNHYIDLRKSENREFLSAKMQLPYTEIQLIYDLLANLSAINQELWNNEIIYCPNFIKNIEQVYSKRKKSVISFSNLCRNLFIKCKHKYDEYGIIDNGNCISVDRNTQSKVKESKVKESRVKYIRKLDEEEAIKCDIIIKSWNTFAIMQRPQLNIVEKLTQERTANILERIQEPQFNIKRILEEAGQSEYLMKQAGWFCFDWLIKNDSNYIKLIEGNYRNGKTKINAGDSGFISGKGQSNRQDSKRNKAGQSSREYIPVRKRK